MAVRRRVADVPETLAQGEDHRDETDARRAWDGVTRSVVAWAATHWDPTEFDRLVAEARETRSGDELPL